MLLMTLSWISPKSAWAGIDPEAQYTRRLWRVQDGLPENIVQALAQTRDGYLWIGTTGGLARFDGSRFTVFDETSTPGFQANSIFCIVPASDGTLWLGSEGSGLVHFANGRVRTFGVAQGLTDGFVRSLLRDETGTLWIGTDNGLFQMRATRPTQMIRRVDTPGRMRPIAVHAMMEDREHRIWIGGSRLIAVQNGHVQNEQLPGLYSQNRVKSILETMDGTVWVGTVGGLDRLGRDGRFASVPEVVGTVRVLRQTEDGTLWIGTIGHGLWTYRAGRFTHVLTPDLLPSKTVLSVYEDRSHQVWVGTQDGLVCLSSTPVRVLALPGDSDADFGTISPDGIDDVWVVSSGLFHVAHGVARRYVLPALGSIPVRNVFRDREGGLWVGTDGSGAFHFAADGSIRHYSAPRELTNNFVRVFYEGARGDVWIGTDQGISHLTASGVRKYGVKDGLAYFSIRCLLADRKSDLLIGTDQGLSIWRNGKFLHTALTEALRRERIWFLLQDANGVLWIGTRDSGLFRFRDGHLAHFTTAQGLASNSIYGIVEDGHGRLWLSGPNALSSAPIAQMDRSPSAPWVHLDVTTYEMPFGAADTQFYGGRQPSGFVDAQGSVWFASSAGPVYVAQDQLRSQHVPAPELLLRSVTADGRTVSTAGGQLQISSGTSRLEFSYAPLMLRPQNAIRFRYRLEGYDTGWTYAGESRTASYTNLRAGHYRFDVVAFPANDPARITEASITLRKHPHIYQTWWFAAVSLLLLAGTAWAIYRSHIRGMRLRFEAVLAERSRLAREMHDTVIQGCTSISALLEAIASRNLEQPESSENALLGYARTQIMTTIHEAREAVWNLRHGEGHEDDLLSSLSTLAGNASQEFGVSVLCRREGRPFQVKQWIAHELLMAVREAVYNAMLHGHPQYVTVTIAFTARKLRIHIADDGSGFDPASTLAAPGVHYGIVGMRERIQRLGGDLYMRSAPGQGTVVEMVVKRRLHLQAAHLSRVGS